SVSNVVVTGRAMNGAETFMRRPRSRHCYPLGGDAPTSADDLTDLCDKAVVGWQPLFVQSERSNSASRGRAERRRQCDLQCLGFAARASPMPLSQAVPSDTESSNSSSTPVCVLVPVPLLEWVVV